VALTPSSSRTAFGAASGILAGTYPAPVWPSTIGLYNVTPTAQHAAIPDAAGGVVIDVEGRAATNAALDALRDIGLIAT
jgi:hypothetical protein